jgi:VanZ family protein
MPSASYLPANSSQPALTLKSQRWPANCPANSNFLTWLPVALFLGIFAMESTRQFGSDHTSAPLHHIFQMFFGSALDADWSFIHHIIRKTGHFTAYGTFSLFAYKAAASYLRDRITNPLHRQQLSHSLAIAATLAAASADEIHQSFLPNRSGSLSDVLLDTAGAVTLQLALIILFHLTAKNSKARASSPESNPDSSELHPSSALAA